MRATGGVSFYFLGPRKTHTGDLKTPPTLSLYFQGVLLYKILGIIITFKYTEHILAYLRVLGKNAVKHFTYTIMLNRQLIQLRF